MTLAQTVEEMEFDEQAGTAVQISVVLNWFGELTVTADMDHAQDFVVPSLPVVR